MVVTPRSAVAVLLALVGASSACGRTEPVRYTGLSGEDQFQERGEDGGIICVNGALALRPARPVVMLVVDRSSSMNQAFPGTGSSKWNALRGALHQQLPAWNDSLELGLQLFPEGSNSSCSVSATPTLTPTFQSVEAILSRLDASSPGGSTPTALGVERAGNAILGLRTASSAKALILATDGAPDCNSALSPMTCKCINGGTCTSTRCLDDTRTLDRITTLANSGVPTWIIGLRSSNDATFVDVLNRMADAGGKPQQGTSERFFSASSQGELQSAFAEIRRQVGTCRYLTASVPDPGGSIELDLDGQFVPYDETQQNGWAWIDAGNGELALFGTTCVRAEALDVSALQVVVKCAHSP